MFHLLSGNVFTDVVAIGDISIPNQAVELAEKLSSSFEQDGGSDGLLGLAWPSLNTVKPKQQATPVENMINQNIISPVSVQFRHFTVYNSYLSCNQALFTANLDRGDNNGFYTFGVIDAAKAGVSESE